MLFEPLNSSHLDQSDDLSRLPDVAEVLEGDEGEGDVEGEEGEEVDQVHRLDEEPRLDRTAQQPVKKKLQLVHKKIKLPPEAVFYREDHHRCFVKKKLQSGIKKNNLRPYSIEKITTVVLSTMSIIHKMSSSSTTS